MKKLIFIMIAILSIAKSQGGVPPGSQGIGVNPPKAMLHVKGEILVDSVRSTPVQDGMIQYKSNQFLFRQNGAWLPLGSGSASNAGSGMTKRNDTLIAGGKLKNPLIYQNVIDTIFGIDTLGHIYSPGIYTLDDITNAGFIIDSNFITTTDLLIDSLLLNFGLLPSQFCHTSHTAGVVNKLNKKDGVLYTLDTTNTGACRDSTLYSILQLKFAPVQLPRDAFVDSFRILFSGYDTLILNINGNASGEGYPLIFMNQGRKIIYNHFSQNGLDSMFNSFTEPFSTGNDTITFLNYHFSENTFNTIDSITLSFLVPLRGSIDFKFLIDKITLVFPYKPVLRNVLSWGGNLLTIPYANATNANYISGNGITANGNAFDLGDFTDNLSVNAQGYDYVLSGGAFYNINGTTVQMNGNNSTNGHGVVLDGSSNSFNGTYIRGSSSSSEGIHINGISQDKCGTYIKGNCFSQSASDIEFYPTNGSVRFLNIPTNNSATQVLAASSSSSNLVWREISTLPANTTAGNGLYNVDASTVALNNANQALTDDIHLHGGDNDKNIWITGYGNVSNYTGVQIIGNNTSGTNPALNIQGNNAGSTDDIAINSTNGKLRFYGLPDDNNSVALLGKTFNGRSVWVSNPTVGTSSLSTNTAITSNYSTYIMDFTSNGSGTSSNELPALSSVPNGFTVRIRRTDNNSSFIATIITHTGSGDIITDIDNANVSTIGISSGTTDNYIEFTAFINGINGYGGITKWVVMNKH